MLQSVLCGTHLTGVQEPLLKRVRLYCLHFSFEQVP